MKYIKILVTIGLLVLIAVITTVLVIVTKQSPDPLDVDSNHASESVETSTTVSENVTSETEPAESSVASVDSKAPADTSSDTPSESNPAESKPNEPVDSSYYKDACFIGDSRSEGFMMYAGPAEASYYVYKGLTVSGFFSTEFVKDGDRKITAAEALKNKQFGKVYIMLGINELGWSYSSVFYEKYCDIIDYIREVQPDAKIFVQSIFPVSAKKSAKDAYVNNTRIQEYNHLIKKMCVEKSVVYLDVGQALQDENGNLPEEAAFDGVHLNKPYCEKWRVFLDTHTDVEAASESEVG